MYYGRINKQIAVYLKYHASSLKQTLQLDTHIKWLYFASKLSWDITTAQINSTLHLSGVDKSSTSFGWCKDGKVTAAG